MPFFLSALLVSLTPVHSDTYPVCMKNLTLSVDEQVLKAVRQYAAKQETSVNGLVRGFLAGIADREARAEEVRRRMKELSESSSARIGERAWARDELHER